MTARAALVVLLGTAILVGCSGAAPTIAPPLPSVAATHSPADVARIVGESIDQLYCGTVPKPDWCAALTIENGAYSVAIMGGTLLAVGTHALSPALAADLCASVATAHFDENALPLPFTGVVIVGPGQKTLAQCRVGG